MAPDEPDEQEVHEDPEVDPERIELDSDLDEDTRREGLELELMDEDESEAGSDIGEEME